MKNNPKQLLLLVLIFIQGCSPPAESSRNQDTEYNRERREKYRCVPLDDRSLLNLTRYEAAKKYCRARYNAHMLNSEIDFLTKTEAYFKERHRRYPDQSVPKNLHSIAAKQCLEQSGLFKSKAAIEFQAQDCSQGEFKLSEPDFLERLTPR